MYVFSFKINLKICDLSYSYVVTVDIYFKFPPSSLRIIGPLVQGVSPVLPVKHSVGERRSPRQQGGR